MAFGCSKPAAQKVRPSLSIFFNLFQSKYSICNRANSSLAFKKPTLWRKCADVKKTITFLPWKLIKLEKLGDSY
jgi:hypothetical protein